MEWIGKAINKPINPFGVLGACLWRQIAVVLRYNPLISTKMMTQDQHTTETKRSIDWLSKGDLRPTRQRQIIAECLVGDGHDRHVTAESLYDQVAHRGASVSLATVYNTLRAFCDAGLIREITVDGSKSYFDTNMSDHPHFFWEDEGKLSDAPKDQLVIGSIPDAPEGAEIAKVDVVIRLRRTGA